MSYGNSEQLMSVIQAGFRLRINPRWLQTEAEAGRIPSLDCGGTRMVNLEAVKLALAERAAQVPPVGGGGPKNATDAP